MAKFKDWREMREWEIGLLQRQTGQSLEFWNAKVLDSGAASEPVLRDWLTGQGVTGYPRMLLVMERFGYPDFLLATSDELLDGQYADRPQLRPILDRLLEVGMALGAVSVQTRKTYVTLVGPRRTFAQVVATTRNRVDLGLRLDGEEPHGRFLPAKSLGNQSCSVRVALTAVDEVDAEVIDAMQRTYDANL
jgi:hypothetical protein